MGYYEEGEQYFLHAYGRYDTVLDHGEGVYLYDTEGNKYLDFYSGIGLNSLGYGYPAYVEAVEKQLKTLTHVSNYFYTVPAIEAAKKVVEATRLSKVFFCNSGAEATEGALKLARKYYFLKHHKADSEVIAFHQSFHGRTTGSVKLTGNAHYQQAFGPLMEGVKYATLNDLESVKALLTDRTGAIIVEPVQGEGGVHPATQEFMKGLREFCDENDMLLLIDEVQTGWCRTGAVMSYMNYGIKPDIVSMAKGLGGGMPIGAICATAEVAKAFTPGSHGTTFGGHPISCAAALAEVGELLDRDLAGNAKKVGDYFAAKLEKLPHVKEVRHQGLLVGVEFDDTISGVDVKHGCFDRKLLITAIGAHIIRMVPPLIVSEEECDKAVEIIEEAVKALS